MLADQQTPPARARNLGRIGVTRFIENCKRLQIDVENRIRFGPGAPLFAERIFIEPTNCVGVSLEKKRILGWHREASGRVIYDWPIYQVDLIPIEELPRVKFCVEHWVNGVAWEDTGIFEFYLARSLDLVETRSKKIDKLVKKYQNLDRIFETVRLEGRLRTKRELDPHHFRELDGIRINIGPSGQLVFADGGTHRLAMALILGIRVIPAQLGCLHRAALDELRKLRISPMAPSLH